MSQHQDRRRRRRAATSIGLAPGRPVLRLGQQVAGADRQKHARKRREQEAQHHVVDMGERADRRADRRGQRIEQQQDPGRAHSTAAGQSHRVTTFMPSAKSWARTARPTSRPTSAPARNARPMARPSSVLWAIRLIGPSTRQRRRGARHCRRVLVRRRSPRSAAPGARARAPTSRDGRTPRGPRRGESRARRPRRAPTGLAPAPINAVPSGSRSADAVATSTPAANAMNGCSRCRSRIAAEPPSRVEKKGRMAKTISTLVGVQGGYAENA